VTAYEGLERALQLNPNDLKMWQEWGELLFRESERENAISFLQEGIRHNPSFSELYYQIAAYYFELKKWNKGMPYLENALILDPGKHFLLFNIFPELRNVPAISALIRQYTGNEL